MDCDPESAGPVLTGAVCLYACSSDPVISDVACQVKEAKGLDMVRRDWCGLAKDCGNFALDRILSGQPCEEVVDAIHAKLQEVRQRAWYMRG